MADTQGVKPYLDRLNKLKSERMTHDSVWQEISDIMLPKRDFTTQRSPGDNRTSKIYDSTGLHAVEQLAGGLHSRLTPPHSKWAFLRIRGREPSYSERRWLDLASSYLFDVFSSPDSGFSTAVYEFFLDKVAFGNSAMSVLYKDRIIFHTEPLALTYTCENELGQLDCVYLIRKYKPVELIRRFGKDNVHEDVVKAYQAGTPKTIEVLQVIEPRDQHYGRGAAKDKKPYKSCFIDVTHKHMMLEDGFDDLPVIFSRWSKRAGETYGYGPGASALSEVKQLNVMVEIMTRAAAKNADPPMLSPAEGLIMPHRLDPGGITFYNPDLGEPKFWQNGFQPNYFDALIEQKKALIQKMFYVDWLNLPALDRATTVEVNQRIQDSLQQLSPMLSRVTTEFLSKVVQRVILLGLDNGDLEKPPRSLQGQTLAVEYTSPIAIAQKAVQAQAVLQGLSIGAQLAQFDPTVPTYVNGGEIFKDQVFNTFYWPTKYIYSDEEVAQRVEGQAQQAQAAQDAQLAESYSKSAKNVAGALSDATQI